MLTTTLSGDAEYNRGEVEEKEKEVLNDCGLGILLLQNL